MKRREFITLLSGAAATWPLTTHAQPGVPIIGVLSSASSHDYAAMLVAFRQALSQGGYVEGENVKIEYVFADEQYDRLPALADDLVRRQVALILAAATPAALAAKAATSTIPIVFAIGGDPVRTGLVNSLRQSGNNLTGAAHVNAETAPKRLELMHELMRTEKVIGLLVNPSNPITPSLVEGVKAAATSLGIELRIVHAQTDAEIDTAFAALPAMKVGALVIGTDPFFTSNSEKLAAMSVRMAVPAIYQYRAFAEAGGVMSYGGSILDSYHQAGVYAARILKGEKPGDLPVHLSTKVELFFNLKSAKALGIDPSLSLLGRADEVIE